MKPTKSGNDATASLAASEDQLQQWIKTMSSQSAPAEFKKDFAEVKSLYQEALAAAHEAFLASQKLDTTAIFPSAQAAEEAAAAQRSTTTAFLKAINRAQAALIKFSNRNDVSCT